VLLFLLNTALCQSAVRNQKNKTAASKVTARQATTTTTSRRTATTSTIETATKATTTETGTKATTSSKAPINLPNISTENIILEVQHRMEDQKRQREIEEEPKSQGKLNSINHPIYLIRCVTAV